MCNLNVLVAAIYRYLHKAELEETNDTTGSPSTHVSFATASRNARIRALPVGHPSVLGPPLAVAVGGITTGGPLASVQGGIRVHTETMEWTHSAALDNKDTKDGKGLASTLDMEDSEDDISMDSPMARRDSHIIDFQQQNRRRDNIPMREFLRTKPNDSKV